MREITRVPVDAYAQAHTFLEAMTTGGVLCTVARHDGGQNVLTLGWGQIGPFYHGRAICTIAVTPLRYSFGFLSEIPEFVLAVPDARSKAATEVCGTVSGRDVDKWEATGLTRVPALHVCPPAILEARLNLECRVYATVLPPHDLLTPEHRQRPLEQQHTIYFAEVLACYRWAE
jgi:flavin reductase (DIM6/NTAB) family NADH-FMN oxidoreductase RutF